MVGGEPQDMLAAMTPALRSGRFFFCATEYWAIVTSLWHRSLAMFRENEAVTLILAEDDAVLHGFERSMPMSWIVLEVFSPLEVSA